MPRPKREDWPGARHHVMNRGARREPLFFTDHHCAEFLGFVSELPPRFGLLIHAYALMPNHYHLLVESTRGELSRGMSYLGSRYAAWLNATRPDWDGPVYRGRFKSKLVMSEEHWHHLPVYLHLNPVRANIVANIDESQWTSHGAYAGTDPIPDWLTVDDLMRGYGSHRGYLDYLSEFHRGRADAPAGFGQVVFTPYARPVMSEAPFTTKRPSAQSAELVLKTVARECAVTLEDLKTVRKGRTGNAAKKIAAYWLVVGAGLPNRDAAAMLQMHPVRVSQTIRELREKMRADSGFSLLMGGIGKSLNS